MSQFIVEQQYDTTRHPLFPHVDQMLRRGAHIGPEDHDKHDFIQSAASVLTDFYERYDAILAQTPEGCFYLQVGDNPLFKTKILSRIDMLIGKTLAAMLLEPDILTTLGRVSLDKLLHTMEMNPGRTVLLACCGIRSPDEETANRKYREAVGKSLGVLHDINVLRWENRDREIIPYKAIMRFADDVRTGASMADNLAAQVAAGSVVVAGETASFDDVDSIGQSNHEED